MTSKRIQAYESKELMLTFDPNLCEHSGVCLRTLPAVFDIGQKRWVRPEGAPAAAVRATVTKCPSGALQYEDKLEHGEQGPES